MIKALFFDIDNTLLSFDGYVKQSMQTGFEKYGLKKYEPYMFGVFTRENNALWRALERGEISFEQIKACRWNNIFAALGIEFDGAEFETYFRSELNKSAIPVEGAKDTLEYLSGRCVLCAASNGPFEQQINRLALGGLHRYFDFFFISEEMGASKPSKEYFDICMARLNDGRPEEILPEECMMVGDSLTSDMAGGIGAGMKTCFFDPSWGKPPDDIRPDHVINALCELKKIII